MTSWQNKSTERIELEHVLRRLFWSGILFAGVMLTGTLGYKAFSQGNASWVDSFYMTGITVSTIGYGEIVDLSHQPWGRIFTVFIAFVGIGNLTYLLTNAASLVVEGKIKRAFTIQKMEKKISSLSDHYIICGAGRVGRNVAYQLHLAEYPFVMADKQSHALSVLVQDLPNSLHLAGDCTEDLFLQQLNITSAKGLFAATGDDNINLVITLTARSMHPKLKIISRCNEARHHDKFKKAGANRVITPTYIGGERMASEMVKPTATDFLDELSHPGNKNIQIDELNLGLKWVGKTIGDIDLSRCLHTIILAVRDGGTWQYNPRPSYVFTTHAQLVVMTTPQDKKILETMID